MRKQLWFNGWMVPDATGRWQAILLVPAVCLFTLLVWAGGAWAAQVAAGYNHTVIVKYDNTLWACGLNNW